MLNSTLPFSTGEKVHQCPDVIKVLGPPGLKTREKQCPYKTNDRSLLNRHRKRWHEHKPRSRPQPEHTESYEFVDCNTVIDQPTDVAGEAPCDTQDTVLENSSPSTSQRGAAEYDQVDTDSPRGTDSGPSGFTNITSDVPFENVASNTHGQNYAQQFVATGSTAVWEMPGSLDYMVAPHANVPNAYGQAYEEHLAATGSTVPSSWATQGSSVYEVSPHASGPDIGITMPVTSHEEYALFDPTMADVYGSTFYASGYTEPFTTGTYNFAPDLDMDTFAMASSDMYSNQPDHGPYVSLNGWGNVYNYNAA